MIIVIVSHVMFCLKLGVGDLPRVQTDTTEDEISLLTEEIAKVDQ